MYVLFKRIILDVYIIIFVCQIMLLLLLTLLSLSFSLSLKNNVNYGSIKPPSDTITNNKQPGGEYGIRQLDIKGNKL